MEFFFLGAPPMTLKHWDCLLDCPNVDLMKDTKEEGKKEEKEETENTLKSW